MKKLVFATLLALSAHPLLAGPSPDDGKRGGRHGKMERFQNPEKMFTELNLTEEQEKKVKELHEGKKGQFEALRKSMQETKKNFQEMMKDTKKSNDELKKVHEAMIEAKSEMMRARFNHMLEIRSILTPEQREKFQVKMQHNKKGRQGRGKGTRGSRKGRDMGAGPEGR